MNEPGPGQEASEDAQPKPQASPAVQEAPPSSGELLVQWQAQKDEEKQKREEEHIQAILIAQEEQRKTREEQVRLIQHALKEQAEMKAKQRSEGGNGYKRTLSDQVAHSQGRQRPKTEDVLRPSPRKNGR